MTTHDAFTTALRELSRRSPAPAPLPARLAQACVAVLPVDAAGLSYATNPERRLPLGASDELAATAERLQFTLGEGPCLTAQRTRQPVTASLDELASTWPVYTAQLTAQTPFRSVTAIPVGGPLSGVAALDLYSADPHGSLAADAPALDTVASLVGKSLVTDMATTADRVLGMPRWPHGPAATLRDQVWRAIGYVSARRGTHPSTSLALLRAHAFTHGIDLEQAAQQILDADAP